MPTYDIHQHLWPEPFVAALAARSAPPRLRGGVLELAGGAHEVDLDAHRLDRRLAALDRVEIDAAVVSLQPTLGIEELPSGEAEPLLEAWHAGVGDLAGAAQGRLLAFASGAPRAGFAGLCVPARALDGLDALAGALDELERSGGVLFVHPGPGGAAAPGAPRWWAFVVDYTAQMQGAYARWLAAGLERWPELRVVFAVLAGGAPFQLERLRSQGVDIRSVLHGGIYFDTASYGRLSLELCLSTFGVGQLVYGSDTPVIDPRPTLQAIRGFGQAVADALCRDNPTLLLE